MSSNNKNKNEFEAKIKITNFPSKEEIIEKINLFCNENKTKDDETSSYDIEKENSNMILLNFHQNTELANFINRELKLLQIEKSNFSNLNTNLKMKLKNPNNIRQKQDKKEDDNKENQKIKKKNINKNKNDIFNIDTKNNPFLNRIISKSLNFSKKNINKYTNPENNKLKIYESIFLGGPYLNKNDLVHEENRKNKEQWLNKKGFNAYISKNTIIKNSHMMDNILYQEPAKYNKFNFRSVEKDKWVGKHDFMAYS